jgi:hypothetical protein
MHQADDRHDTPLNDAWVAPGGRPVPYGVHDEPLWDWAIELGGPEVLAEPTVMQNAVDGHEEPLRTSIVAPGIWRVTPV